MVNVEKLQLNFPRRSEVLYSCGMTTDQPYIPFSQRTGLESIPPQLELGKVSAELRRLLEYYIMLEIEREQGSGFSHTYFGGSWNRVAMDFHVVFLKKSPSKYRNNPNEFMALVRNVIQREVIGSLFDLVEFFIRHPGCSIELKGDLASAFETSRAAYRIFDSQIIAIGVEEQAAAFARAVAETDTANSVAARSHLIAAGLALRNSNWPGSVRESIHAVEAMATRLAPKTQTLGKALTALEKQGHLHGGLKAAFSQLYGYSSDEEGVRHALVFNEEAKVDEADALFMLGACASFVSYLLARGTQSR